MRISCIRLSDWLHREAHGASDQGRRSRRSTPCSPIDNVVGEPVCATSLEVARLLGGADVNDALRPFELCKRFAEIEG